MSINQLNNQFIQTKHSPSLKQLRSLGIVDKEIVDFCIPVNPYFPAAGVEPILAKKLKDALKYYPSLSEDLAKSLVDYVGLDSDHIVLANGSTELITWIDHLFIEKKVLIPIPTFGRWTDQPLETKKQVITFKRKENENFQLNLEGFVQSALANNVDVAVICNPNNPTGQILSTSEIEWVLQSLEQTKLVVIDESFLDFSDNPKKYSATTLVSKYPNLFILKSLGKNMGHHGIRTGIGISSPHLIRQIKSCLPKWNINGIAEVMIEEFVSRTVEYSQSLAQTRADRNYLYEQLQGIPFLTVFPSQSNFVFIKLPSFIEGPKFRNNMLTKHGILIRECSNKIGGGKNYFRIAVHPQDQTDYLKEKLKQEINHWKNESFPEQVCINDLLNGIHNKFWSETI